MEVIMNILDVRNLKKIYGGMDVKLEAFMM